jgi:hypothetical protein
LIDTAIAREHWHTDSLYKLSRGALIAHGGNGKWSGAYEDEASVCASLGKITTFGQKAKTRMNGVGSGAPGSANNGIHH